MYLKIDLNRISFISQTLLRQSRYNLKMRIIFILLTIMAALLTILIIGLTIFLVANGGGVSIVLPGLGLIVSLSFILVLLAAIDALIIFLALLFRRMSKQQRIP